MANILETARDLGQSIYTQAEVDNKPTGFKNYIINGGFDVWQRGTNGGTTNGYADADRFKIYYTTSRGLSDALSYPNGFSKALKITKSAGQDTQIIQAIEITKDKAITEYNGRTFTFSAWVLSDMVIEHFFVIKRGTSPNSYEIISQSSPNVTLKTNNTINQWTMVEFSVVFDWQYEDGDYIEIRIDPPNDSSGTLHTTGWQLEEGSVATPFEHRPYGLELSLCQRYYQTTESLRWDMYMASGDDWFGFYPLSQNMRTAPHTVSASYSCRLGATLSYSSGSTSRVFFYGSSTTSAGSQYYIVDNLTMSAEL